MGYRSDVVTPLGHALRAALNALGMTVAELARDVGIPEPSLRSIVDGKVSVPQRPTRDALDAYFTPGLPAGTTLRICREITPGYPVDRVAELIALFEELPEPAQRALINFLQILLT